MAFSCCWMEYNAYMLPWFILDFEIIWMEDTFKLVTWKYVRISTQQLRKTDSWGVHYLIRILVTSIPCMLYLRKKNSKHLLKSYFCHEHLLPVKQMVTTVSSLSFILCRGSSLHISKFKMKVRLQRVLQQILWKIQGESSELFSQVSFWSVSWRDVTFIVQTGKVSIATTV